MLRLNTSLKCFRASMPAPEFTKLPAEVRNAIYSFCTPFAGHRDEFRGLRLASNQIGTEYESEATAVISRYLSSIEKNWPHQEEIHFDRPSTFSDLANITVRLPVSLYYPPQQFSTEEAHHYGENTRFEPCLAPLFTLYISQLTFGCYHNSKNALLSVVPTGFLYDLTNILLTKSTLENSEHAVRTRLGAFRFEQSLNIQRLCYRWLQHEGSSSWRKLEVETVHNRFFLNEPLWWEVPNSQTLVSNWGSSSRAEVFFDICS
jgi:hypothetical protein